EHVLGRDDREPRTRRVPEFDQAPVWLVGIEPGGESLLRRQAPEPADGRGRVVRARVRNRVDMVVRGRVWITPARTESPEQDDRPRQAELIAQPVHRRRDVTEV